MQCICISDLFLLQLHETVSESFGVLVRLFVKIVKFDCQLSFVNLLALFPFLGALKGLFFLVLDHF